VYGCGGRYHENGGIQQCTVDEMATILEHVRALPADAPAANTEGAFHCFVAKALGIAVRCRCTRGA
jgi:hypothetical protein